MKKNINRSNGKKLDSAGKNNKAIKPSQSVMVQRLKRQIERTDIASAPRLKKSVGERKPVTFYIGIDLGDKKKQLLHNGQQGRNPR